MLYRDHRGSLEDSMKTVQEFNSMGDLNKYLSTIFSDYNRIVIDIKFEYKGFDPRIGWETYYVFVKLNGVDEFMIVGMSNSIC